MERVFDTVHRGSAPGFPPTASDRNNTVLWDMLSAAQKRALNTVAKVPYAGVDVMMKSTRRVLLERGFIEWDRPEPERRSKLRVTDRGRGLIEWAERS
jgi:hypothetical protein